MERQSADLSTTAGSCRRYDSRRHSQRRRSVAIGAQCRGGISGKSPHRSQGLSTTGQRGVGRDQARPRHVRQCRRARSAAQGRTAEVSYRPMARNRRNHSAARDHTERIAESGQDYESKMRSPNLSNTASNLSGFASLRETSETQGRKTLFTLRRQGAKKASQSKSTIRSLDLSGFAPLREPSATQGREEFFTPRRQGAKRRNRSKYQRFFGHTIGDALNAVLDHVLAEINKEAKPFIHQPQIGQDLFAVDRIERSDRFHLHDHEIIDDQIGAETFVEPDPIPRDRNRYLSFHGVATFAQFMRKQDFVYDFEDARPQPGVQAVGSVNDHSRDFILFHRAKLVLLLLACEAKNLSAVVSFRETSATRSQEDFFTLSRKGAQKAFQSKSTIRSLDLSGFASLREISAKRSREEFFTLRREGAKKAFESKTPISSLHLSGFASLREISANGSEEEFFTVMRKGEKK